MKKPITITIVAAITFTLAACSADPEPTATPTAAPTVTATQKPTATVEPAPEATPAPVAGDTPITITAGDTVITATLNDSQVSQDFIAMLPITLSWFRNYGIEYITELSAPLTEDGPFYTDVQPGDLVYYNPMDSITIIYEETSSVPTLTYMGEITSDLAVFRNLPDNVDLLIALAE
jgi:hypothetical protein